MTQTSGQEVCITEQNKKPSYCYDSRPY